MRRDLLDVLACPVCRAAFDLDPIRATPGEVTEAFLVCRGRRDVRVVVGGTAVLPRRLEAHLRSHGSVYRRTPLSDPRLARFLLGHAADGYDHVPFREVLARYGHLALAGTPAPRADEDVDLDALLVALGQGASGRRWALDVGCGVGRGTFVLAQHAARALGLDRSAARVRRARNIAATREPFLVPSSSEGRATEVPLDLGALPRDGVEFAVAEAEALPLADRSMDLVVLRDGDGDGAFEDPPAAVREALRVLAPGGILVHGLALPASGAVLETARRGAFAAGRAS